MNSGFKSDTVETISSWRIIHLMGVSALRARYSRSRFGQLWIAISNLVFITFVGLVWAHLWSIDPTEYIPYVGVSYILFMFLSSSISECFTVLSADSRIYINEHRPFLVSSAAIVYKSLLVLAHNFPFIVILSFAASSGIGLGPFLFFIYLSLTICFLLFAGYVVSMICARFRDLIQVFSLIMQGAFLLTPVMWKSTLLSPKAYAVLIFLNPLAAFLELLRGAMFNLATNQYALISAFLWTLAALILANLVYKTLNREMVFWI